MSIIKSFQKIRQDIPKNVDIVVAAKQRSVKEIKEVIEAGATMIGYNYVQEAEKIYQDIHLFAPHLQWHMIGPLQKNKINKAIRIFNVFQTVSNIEQAEALNKRVKNFTDQPLTIYIEINIGNEVTKSGIDVDDLLIEDLAKKISTLDSLQLEGIMTLGPYQGNPELCRPFFRKTKHIFEYLKSLQLPHSHIKTLSMGMSNSYKTAIEEGSNMIRLGTVLFGERQY